MKNDLTTLKARTNSELLHAALSGNRDAQKLFDYGRPEVTQESEYDEEKRLDNHDRAEDMNQYRRL